jgi:hypothetical protein
MNQVSEQNFENTPQEEKTADSSSTGFFSFKSSFQNSLKPSCRPSVSNIRSPIPEAVIESEVISLNLPDYGSENSIASWNLHGSPTPIN